ncbi:MAG: hypothetical protein MJB14_04810 [Spirochaetes bacterium]|nr:hypothetical protein [Spirochaetota bacterium]
MNQKPITDNEIQTLLGLDSSSDNEHQKKVKKFIYLVSQAGLFKAQENLLYFLQKHIFFSDLRITISNSQQILSKNQPTQTPLFYYQGIMKVHQQWKFFYSAEKQGILKIVEILMHQPSRKMDHTKLNKFKEFLSVLNHSFIDILEYFLQDKISLQSLDIINNFKDLTKEKIFEEENFVEIIFDFSIERSSKKFGLHLLLPIHFINYFKEKKSI